MFEQEIESIAAGGSNEEIYYNLLNLTKKAIDRKGRIEGKKKVYYISAEFLIGKLLSNNLINLGLYDTVNEALKKHGKTMADIEEIEPEPSLGNGGLGRLAACFLDSIATLGLPGDGVGLNYHLGLFKQVFEKNMQKETANPWIQDQSWLRRTNVGYPVIFNNKTVQSVMYEIDVTGYDNKVNTLKLFDLDSVDDSIVQDDSIWFNKEEIAKNLTLFLYPDDSDVQGQMLRIYQQYFMVSNAAQLILDEAVAKGSNLYDLPDYAVVQINDTHPTMVIPELIRLLVNRGIEMNDAIGIVTRMCAYTNHTILAEALEKWPMWYLEKVVPQLVPIIKMLDVKVKEKYSDPGVAIIDENNTVHMAHIDIHYSSSVNGVAYLHTEILKNSELKPFYDLYPEKFNNKTNGITQRRFLLHGNPLLADWVTEYAGDGWITDLPKIEKIAKLADDTQAQKEFMEIKYKNKVRLAKYIKEHNGIDVDPNSIFDVQVKRLHEYKRQFMNILHIMYLYDRLKKNPDMPFYPRTFIFGAKASAGYERAKAIIKLINSVGDVVNNDPTIKGKIKVVFIEDYRVSNAELIFAAADVSEQISTASKEASGTGNMKFMLNGALTLGTMDGANVEIVEKVGKENAFIFGLSADQVIEYENNYTYDPMSYFIHDQDIHNVVMDLISGRYSNGDTMMFRDLYDSLLTPKNAPRPDMYFTLADFKSYAAAQERVEDKYRNTSAWARSAILNTAHSGKFTSDRTIQQYVDDIWHLDKITVRK